MRHAQHHPRGPKLGALLAVPLVICTLVMLACANDVPDRVTVVVTPTVVPTGTTTAATTATTATTATATPKPKPTATATPKPTATPVPFKVNSATIASDRTIITSGCLSETLTFTYTFTIPAHTAGGTISYLVEYYEGGLPATAPTKTITVKAGQTSVSTTEKWMLTNSEIFGADGAPWFQMHVGPPNIVTSNKLTIQFNCLA